MTAATNTTGSPRTATITVSGIGANTRMITFTQQSITAISEVKELEYTIYPNPTTDILYFSSPSDNPTVSIFDVSGKIVLTQSLKEKQVNVKSLKSGIYILKLLDDKGVSSKKFIKQ